LIDLTKKTRKHDEKSSSFQIKNDATLTIKKQNLLRLPEFAILFLSLNVDFS
jgi:hypothetical protein